MRMEFNAVLLLSNGDLELVVKRLMNWKQLSSTWWNGIQMYDDDQGLNRDTYARTHTHTWILSNNKTANNIMINLEMNRWSAHTLSHINTHTHVNNTEVKEDGWSILFLIRLVRWAELNFKIKRNYQMYTRLLCVCVCVLVPKMCQKKSSKHRRWKQKQKPKKKTINEWINEWMKTKRICWIKNIFNKQITPEIRTHTTLSFIYNV